MKNKLFFKLLALTAILASILACSLNLTDPGGGGGSLGSTQTSIALQQTDLALQGTSMAAKQTSDANIQAPPTEPPPPTPDFAATSYAISANATATALSAPSPIMAVSPQPPAQVPAQPMVTQPPVVPQNNPAEFQAWMKTANIVVFEDMVVYDAYTPYVKETLKSMGLRFKWDGNAMGWFKTDLLSGANGQPWDLVIIAAEARDQVSGEYFDYLNQVLNNGTPVIMESWYLEDISEGKVAPLLAKCGIQVYPYVPKTMTLTDAVMYPLPPANSPILTSPSTALAWTKASDTWFFSYDLGTKMALTGTGDAQLLLGTDAQEAYKDGTLAVCLGGQLILQGFSSHTFPYKVDGPLWSNMITNALQWRYAHK